MITRLMTTSRQPWLTRGRLLVGLPFGLGVVVSAAVVLVGVLPVAQTLRELDARRDTLLNLQRSRPALERRLTQAEAEMRLAEEKQALLVGLLAGRDKVQTFLALLNQQALASGVQMQRYEPLQPAAPPSASATKRNNNRSSYQETTSADPPGTWLRVVRCTSVKVLSRLQTFNDGITGLRKQELELKAVVDKKLLIRLSPTARH